MEDNKAMEPDNSPEISMDAVELEDEVDATEENIAPLKSVGQHRAAFAWSCVQEARRRGCLPDYAQFSSSLPALIHTGGLGQAVAFMMIQTGGKALILRHLEAWLTSPPPGTIRSVYRSETTIAVAIFEGDSLKLRRATQEAQALLVWVKRFSKAEANDMPTAPAVPPTT